MAFLTQQAMGRATYVLYDAQYGEAFVQVQYRPHQAAADVAYMAPSLASNRQANAGKAWSRLLDGVSVEIAARGIQRLFASLPEAGPEQEIFQQSGFSRLCLRRHIPPGASARRSGCQRRARPATAADRGLARPAKAVHRHHTPAGAPDRRRHRHHTGRGQASPGLRPARVRGRRRFAGGEGNRRGRPDRRALPAHRQAGPLAAAAGPPRRPRRRRRRGRPGLCPGWQASRRDRFTAMCGSTKPAVAMPLQAAGFELDHTRTLMVKQTTAWAKAPVQELVPALKGSAEPVFHSSSQHPSQQQSKLKAGSRPLSKIPSPLVRGGKGPIEEVMQDRITDDLDALLECRAAGDCRGGAAREPWRRPARDRARPGPPARGSLSESRGGLEQTARPRARTSTMRSAA